MSLYAGQSGVSVPPDLVLQVLARVVENPPLVFQYQNTPLNEYLQLHQLVDDWTSQRMPRQQSAGVTQDVSVGLDLPFQRV